MATTNPTRQTAKLQSPPETDTPERHQRRLAKRRANYHKKKHLIRPKERTAERERYWRDPAKMRQKARVKYQRGRVKILKRIQKCYAADPVRQQIHRQRAKDYARRHPETRKAYRQKPEVKMKESAYVRRPETRLHTRAKRLRKYGMTLEDYNALMKKQNGLCAICRQPEQANTRWTKRGDIDHFVNLKVDHCHATGKVRGLLCVRCNLGLGYFHDDPTLLANAITYLQS